MNKSTLNFLQNMINECCICAFEDIESFLKYKKELQGSLIFEVDLKSFSSMYEKDFNDITFQVYIPKDQIKEFSKEVLSKLKKNKIFCRVDDFAYLNNSYLRKNSYKIVDSNEYFSLKNRKNLVYINNFLDNVGIKKCSIFGFKIGKFLEALCLQGSHCKILKEFFDFSSIQSIFYDLRFLYTNDCKQSFFDRYIRKVDPNIIDG